jgi:hypothetical protein
MKALIAHLLKCNMEQILARSLMHCHAPHLHSIMLLECPGKTIRLFVAEAGHNLWCNAPEEISQRQSLAIHPHHCDLTLIATTGNVWNWIFEEGVFNSAPFSEFEYNSQITKGKIGFQKKGEAWLRSVEYLPLDIGEPKHLHAKEMHTVVVPEGQIAAWFALEGKEDATYESRCFSMTDLEAQNFDHLYKPMNETELYRLLLMARLL